MVLFFLLLDRKWGSIISAIIWYVIIGFHFTPILAPGNFRDSLRECEKRFVCLFQENVMSDMSFRKGSLHVFFVTGLFDM